MNTENEPIIPPDDFVFVPFGGATEIGLNFFAYGYKGKWLIVDCGIGFPDDGLPGIETLIPNADFLHQHQKDIVGMVITHAHEDHIGAIGYLWPELQCPVYATPFTAELIEYKLDEEGLLGRVPLITVALDGIVDLDPFEVEFVAMNHSLPEPSALIIRTDKGVVLHTGDWKIDNAPVIGQKMDTRYLKEIGKQGVLAMVCDSTNVTGTACDKTEVDVQENLTKLIAQYPENQIAVACFASNLARVKGICHAAQQNNRKVCLLGRSLWRIQAAAKATNYWTDLPECLTEQEALELPVTEVLYICTGSQGEPFAALNNLAALTPKAQSVQFGTNDVVIFSSRIIPGNEKAIAFLQKKLKAKGIKIITDKEEKVHVSGHYSGKDLEKMYNMIKPHIAVPVHGEPLELTAHADIAKKLGVPYSFSLNEGQVLNLSDNPTVIENLPTGVLAVDGKQIIPLSSAVIKKRRKFLESRALVVSLAIDSAGFILGKPKIAEFGLMDAESEEYNQLLDAIEQAVLETPDKQKSNDEYIENSVSAAVRAFISEHYGKKTMVEIHLLRV